MSEQEENIQEVMDILQSVAPAAEDAPRPASQALAVLRRRNEPRRRIGPRALPTLFGRRYAWATLMAVLALVVAMSFPGVRAAASDFLGLFRVQKFTPISISAEQLALLEDVAGSGLYPGEVVFFEEPSEPVRVDSLAEAEAAAGWQAGGPGQLGEPDAIYVIGGASGRLTINVENARTLMSLAGADPELIPDSLDGAEVNVTVYPAISQNWDDGVVLIQSPSPLVAYPEDVNVTALGQALLEVLGMEPGPARRLAESIEWTNTVLLPVPASIASFSEVQIGGSSGLALTSVDGQNAAVLWESEGMVFVLSGFDAEELVGIANSVG
ncbi:MAG TPA: hypothetical protein VLE70_15850 [Anaerolineae bacterium]|jgi:hypothetical protein|nr:hypothetical protein [Anaerolineae bacterium]